MLPCSVRRVAVAATAPQSPLLSTLPRATTAATSSATVTSRAYRPTQQRRYSSSKPSRDNGSEDPPVRQSVRPSAADANKSADAKASGEKRKRKVKDKDASEKLRYPSVPTTAHIPSDFLALSSFFSLHRPISVTRGLPRNVTDDAFAAIFAPQTRGQKAAEVMTTLSRTVEELDQQPNMATLSLHQQQQQQRGGRGGDEAPSADHFSNEPHHNGGLQKIDLRGPDGVETSITVQVQNMSGQFLPFRPPPVPQPEDAFNTGTAAEATEASSAAAMMESAAEQDDTHTRVYKAVFTIEETTDTNGEVKIVAHSPELIEEGSPSSDRHTLGNASPEGRGEGLDRSTMSLSVDGAGRPRTFLERMALRQLQYEDAQSRRGTLWCISVKRQRKLKMKKKKYKKLTKRLRHERLKHGRT